MNSAPGQAMDTAADLSCPCTPQAPVVLSRDHHDVSGTDSPFRETSNIYDGSAFCAGEEDGASKMCFCWIWILCKNQVLHSICHGAAEEIAGF